MPHTGRKKKTVSHKRVQVVDEDGWTRVTSTAPSGLVAPAPASAIVCHAPIPPVEGVTLGSMQLQYARIEKRWLDSGSWEALQNILVGRILPLGRRISACVILGSGSPSGSRGGWINRQDVALYQIAAFKAVVDVIERVQGNRPECIAQEPFYNDLDGQFLQSLAITKVDHPRGFGFSTDSLVYTPGAEPDVEMQTLRRDPDVLIHRSLDRTIPREMSTAGLHEGDTTLGEVTEAFQRDHESAKLPDLDAKDFPFYDQLIYWRKPTDPASQAV